MKNIPKIRQALEADASGIAELIYSTSVACCFTPEQPCPEWYVESVKPSQIADLLKSEQMVWLVAAQEQTLAGVLAVSDKSHVKYFFVHPAYQKLGIGKQLSNFALSNGELGNSLAVRSSLFMDLPPPQTIEPLQNKQAFLQELSVEICKFVMA